MKNPQIAHPSELQIKLHSTGLQILLQHKRFADFYAQALTLQTQLKHQAQHYPKPQK